MAENNFIKKEKAVLAKDVAEIYNHEVLGINSCNVTWTYLAKKYLILDALKCAPYGLYSKEDIACLKGKVNEKCNC
jgi:hypothetical protein